MQNKIVEANIEENNPPTSHNQCHNKCLHIDKQSEMQQENILYLTSTKSPSSYLIFEYVTKNTCISTVYNISQGVVYAEIH